jgi:hypothetical protein
MKTEIEKLKPCMGAVAFRRQFKTFEQAWENCFRGDWMLWLASKLKIDKRKLVLAKALCAETVIHLVEDERSVQAIETAKAYGYGNVTEEDLKAAAAAAAAAIADAYADACITAAAAANAAAAASADAYVTAAAAADAAADAVAFAAAYFTADAAKKENQKQTADICRKILTNEVLEKIKLKSLNYGTNNRRYDRWKLLSALRTIF